MSRSRRLLPSISQLTAFEAVLRSGSTAAAARDLQLSQGAISRLVQNMETQLGQRLFVRERQKLTPTQAALSYGRDITRALNLIARAGLELTANPEGGALSLAVLPAFSTHWLAPRMVGFMQEHPGVAVNLATRMKKFNFAAESFDAAIHFGQPDWRGAGHLHLFEEMLIPCASPQLVTRWDIQTPKDLTNLPLLQIETRPTAWADWFKTHNITLSPQGAMMFDQFAPMAQAAIHGLGIALLPAFQVSDDLIQARLVQLPGEPMRAGGSYWLVWPEARADYPPLMAFRHWIAHQLEC